MITICPVHGGEINIPLKDIKISVVMKAQAGGHVLVGCPDCARALEITDDVPDGGKKINEWAAAIDESGDWLGCVPWLNDTVLKTPTGSTGDLALKEYVSGAGSKPLRRWEYMAVNGIDPEIHLSLNPGMNKKPFDVSK